MKKLVKKIFIGFVAGVISVSMIGCGKPDTKVGDKRESAGEKFPEFTGTDFEGNKVDEGIFKKNKVTVLNFWFNGCSACVNEMPGLEKFNKELKGKETEIVGVNVRYDDDKELQEAKEIVKKQGVTYKNITIDGGDKAKKYLDKIMAFPTTVLVDQDGNVIGKPISGNIDNEKSQKEILKMIEGISDKKKKIENQDDDKVKSDSNQGNVKPENNEGEGTPNSESEALNEQINNIFDSHKELWGKILENAENDSDDFSYEKYLKKALEKTMEKSKTALSDEEVKMAKEDIEKITKLDMKIKELQK